MKYATKEQAEEWVREYVEEKDGFFQKINSKAWNRGSYETIIITDQYYSYSNIYCFNYFDTWNDEDEPIYKFPIPASKSDFLTLMSILDK